MFPDPNINCNAITCIHWNQQQKGKCMWLGYTLDDKAVVIKTECLNYEVPDEEMKAMEARDVDGDAGDK